MLNTIDQATVDALKTNAAEALDSYSAAHQARLKIETVLAGVADRYETLRNAESKLTAGISSLWQAAIPATIVSPVEAKSFAGELAPSQLELKILSRATRTYAAGELADARRALLVATIEEHVAHRDAETARLQEHDATLAVALEIIARLDGGSVEVTAGRQATALRVLISEIGAQITRARGELAELDHTTAELRAELANEKENY